MRNLLVILLFILSAETIHGQKLRVAVAGIDHGHVGWILGRKDTSQVVIVGIYAADTAFAGRTAREYGLPRKLFYTDLGLMLDRTRPDAVLGFGSTASHLSVVQAAAPRRIHVMVEKPLATTVADAEKMATLARRHGIHLLTDYETSWYPSVAKSFQLVHDSSFIGTVRKVVVHDGHEGPKEIGCGPEFLAWLTDPVLNGGGALMDFGCYGANLMTKLMKGQAPVSVTATARHFKPAIYPKVEDDATIIVDYPGAQCVIQASWNWPYSRKDMEIYGDRAAVFALDNHSLQQRTGSEIRASRVTDRDVAVYEDPFLYLRDVVSGKLKPLAEDLYSLENNLLVVRILAAAKESVRTGKTIRLK